MTVRCLMILIAAALLIVQKRTVEPVLNRPLILAMAWIIAFNQVLTAFERPLDYAFTSFTSMMVLFIIYFAFPFRLSTRVGITLAMMLAEAYFIIWHKTFFIGGKTTVFITYFSFNLDFMYWSASLNTMRRKSFMDVLRIREAKEQSELLYRSLSHDIRAPMAGLLLGSEQMSKAIDAGDIAKMRKLTDIFGATLLSSWTMTENLLEWGLLSRLRQADPRRRCS